MRDSFIRLVTEKAARDKNIYLLTADLGFSVFERFALRFPDRFINTGIAEANMIGVASGLALSGRTAVTYSIIPFSVARCLDQIRVDICYQRANVKIVGVGAGYAYGPLGATHHAIEDMAVMRAYPNLRILSPCGAEEATACLELALRTKGPFYIRLGKRRGRRIHNRGIRGRLGGMNILRKGGDVTIFATGSIVERAIAAADILSGQGLAAGVISVYSIKPMDEKMIIHAARRAKIAVTVEEHNVIGGFGGAVAEVLAGSSGGLNGVPLLRMGIPDTFCDVVGDQAYLLDRCGLSPEDIAGKITARLRSLRKRGRG